MATKEYKKFTKDEISEIRNWANSNITSILSHFKIKYDDRGKYLSSNCPIPYHPGDRTNRKAFVWSCDKATWRCYSHGCQEDTSSDIFGLVMSLKEMAFPQAINYLLDMKEGRIEEFIPLLQLHQSSLKRESSDNKIIDKEKLSILMPDKYFQSRGISPDILLKHKVGYWQKSGTFMDKRAIVPIFDINDNLIGFSGRITTKELEGTESKWVHGKDFVIQRSDTFNKTSILYNLNNAKDAIIKSKKVYIVEGPIDVWRLEMAGITNVVATLGLGLSFEQQKLLISLGVELVVLCYDNDEETRAGELAANRIQAQISHIFNVEIKLPKNNHDYGEMSVGEILENILNE